MEAEGEEVIEDIYGSYASLVATPHNEDEDRVCYKSYHLVRACVYVYVHVCTHVYMCMCMRAHVCTHVCVCMCVHMGMCVFVVHVCD